MKQKPSLENLTKKNMAQLKRGRAKSLGPIEARQMRRRGKKDGCMGLPVRTEKDLWLSPFMNQEYKRFAEFCGRQWGDLQLASESHLTKLANLTDDITAKTDTLAHLSEELAQAASAAPDHSVPVRKHGEESLNDSQVKARRSREAARRLAPVKSKISQLQSEIAAEKKESSEIRNQILEAARSTHLICERVMQHSSQRLAAYWQEAYDHHPAKEEMPVIYAFALTSEAEHTYINMHKDLLGLQDEEHLSSTREVA